MNVIVVDPELQSLIPPLAPEEFALLEQLIIADGCRDPLVLWGDILVDGHNRYAICTKHSLPFNTIQKEFVDRDTVMDWMDANQLGRRNLTNDQRSYIRGRRYNRTKKAQGAEAGGRGNQYSVKSQNATLPDTASILAEAHGVHRATIIRDGRKADALDKLAITAPEQAKAVVNGEKRFNEVRREIKLETVKEAAKMPDAKYRIIYADPPWSYGNDMGAAMPGTTGARDHYPTMSIKDLCAMPIRELCEEDAVLFLWVTSPLLYEAAPLIDAWGFKYKTSFVWDKIKHNMGHYNSVRHEFLLICTRGSCTPDVVQLFDSVQSIERKKHSEKPEEFRVIIDTLYPHGSRLELFRRGEAPPGWSIWGNEAAP